MKKILSGIFKYHVLPIFISLVLLYGLDTAVSGFLLEDSKGVKEEITGLAKAERGCYKNCTSRQDEIELIGSLQSDDQLTLMGSSEFQDLPYSSYFFLPDSLGIPTLAFGHAYHQNFSIACELMAAGDDLEGANVCIMLSPGWFISCGTNVEAFLEFVRPDFLRSIIYNQSVSLELKMHIANYVRKHFDEINNPSKELVYFRNMSFSGSRFWTPSYFSANNYLGIKETSYRIASVPKKQHPVVPKSIYWEQTKKRLEQDFLKVCTNNAIYVDSAYYRQYLVIDGKYTSPDMDAIANDDEFSDFMLVLAILKQYHCKASFVLQPLNPYHYKKLDQFNPYRDRVKAELAKANYPLLDLFVTDKKDYPVGTLKDVMHPGDRGWIDINQFLAKQYTHLR